MPDAQAMPTARTRTVAAPRVIAAGASDDTLMSARDVAEFVDIGYSTLWRHVRTGGLPQPYYMTNRRPRWRLGDLRAAIAAAPRDHQTAGALA